MITSSLPHHPPPTMTQHLTYGRLEPTVHRGPGLAPYARKCCCCGVAQGAKVHMRRGGCICLCMHHTYEIRFGQIGRCILFCSVSVPQQQVRYLVFVLLGSPLVHILFFSKSYLAAWIDKVYELPLSCIYISDISRVCGSYPRLHCSRPNKTPCSASSRHLA
jgi:hypothetical protein